MSKAANKYAVQVNNGTADHYDIEDAHRVGKVYQVGDSALEHARKKLRMAGERGSKDRLQDIREAERSIERAIEQISKAEGESLSASPDMVSTVSFSHWGVFPDYHQKRG